MTSTNTTKMIDEEITFYRQRIYTLTFDRFFRDYCESDTTKEEALKLWEIMVKTSGKKQEIECDHEDGDADEFEDDIGDHRDCAEDDLAREEKQFDEKTERCGRCGKDDTVSKRMIDRNYHNCGDCDRR